MAAQHRPASGRAGRPGPDRGAAPVSHAPPSPLSAGKARALSGRVAGAGRQVDLAPRPDVRGAGHRPHRASPACSEGEDVLNTAKALQALGCPVAQGRRAPGRCSAAASAACASPPATLDFGNSGTGTRLMMGVIAGHDMTRAHDRATPRSSRRPMGRVLEPLKQMGAGGRGGGTDRLPLIAARHAPTCCRSSIGCRCRRRRSSRPILMAGLHAAGRHDRHRGGGDARPHRAHAAPLRRRGDGRRARRRARASP